MHIEGDLNHNVARVLTLGVFPADVLALQESRDFFEQIAFVDYELHRLLHDEDSLCPEPLRRDGAELEPAAARGASLDALVEYLRLVAANYSAQSHHESLYYATVMAHLLYVAGSPQRALAALGAVDVNATSRDDGLWRYLRCRYVVLRGLAAEEAEWAEYLVHFGGFDKTSVAAARWLDLLFGRLARLMGERIEFAALAAQPWGANALATTAFANFLCRHANQLRVSAKFREEYAVWLAAALDRAAAAPAGGAAFPSADVTTSALNAFVDNLFDTLSTVSHSHTILRPAAAKRFLVTCAARTYQSQTVLASLIRTLLDLGQYDEAHAAMKTYTQYVEMDQRQHEGEVDNVLAVVEVHAACILAFSPRSGGGGRLFSHLAPEAVVCMVEELGKGLQRYLARVEEVCQILYGEGEGDRPAGSGASGDGAGAGDLSFLFERRNPHLLFDLPLVSLLLQARFALARFHQYLASFESSTEAQLAANTALVLAHYKRGLVVNPAGNSELLFSYALALACTGRHMLAARLCRFVLKRYPENFKTWNLLVLVLTLQPQATQAVSAPSSALIASAAGTEAERMVASALNIAALFIDKHNRAQGAIKLSFETKYHIMQLKLTQLAVWESVHGVEFAMEHLADVFGLFHEMFGRVAEAGARDEARGDAKGRPDAAAAAWSHRPSLIDPKAVSGAVASSKAKSKGSRDASGGSASAARKHSIDVEHISEKLKHLSAKPPKRSGSRSGGGAPAAPARASAAPLAERALLQDLWLWTASFYLRVGNTQQAEECIVEAESVHEPNVKTSAALGLLTLRERKFLSLQEFEKALEQLERHDRRGDRRQFGITLLGLCKLFLVDDERQSLLFISPTDLEAGVIRLKNYLEQFTMSWPHGRNLPEAWWFLSLIYERIDDKVLLDRSLWRCVELEDSRPVRSFLCLD